MKTHRSLASALALGILALAACGENDEDEVRALVKLTIASDPARCDSMTRSFVEQTAGGVEECRNAARQNDPFEGAAIEGVAVDGSKATATVGYRKSRTVFRFVEEDGDWKLDGVGDVSDDSSTSRPAGPPPAPKIIKGLGPRATVDAYYQAIDDGDGAALCGLLSRRYAVEIRGGSKTATPIADCVKGLQAHDWSDTRDKAKGVRIVDVIDSARTATVVLSNGKRALVKKHRGRWVIDDIKAKR
jgi:hypothetical protein